MKTIISIALAICLSVTSFSTNSIRLMFGDKQIASASNHKEMLYESLQYSGLVTESMSFEEMCAVLAEKYPYGYPVTYICGGNTYTELIPPGNDCLTPVTFNYNSLGFDFIGWSKLSDSTILVDEMTMYSEPATLYGVYSAYRGGKLASGVSNTGFTNNGSYLYVTATSPSRESGGSAKPASASGYIEFDATGFDNISFVVYHSGGSGYGTFNSHYGIDSANTQAPTSATTVVLDISELEGLHKLYGSTYSSQMATNGGATTWCYISNVLLYN